MMANKSQMGRPPVDTQPVNLRLPRSMIDAIDDLRRKELDLPTRPEMIRRLLSDALGMKEAG